MSQLKNISNILEAVAQEVTIIPNYVYVGILLLTFVGILCYNLILPKCKIDAEKLSYYRKICMCFLVFSYIICVFEFNANVILFFLLSIMLVLISKEKYRIVKVSVVILGIALGNEVLRFVGDAEVFSIGKLLLNTFVGVFAAFVLELWIFTFRKKNIATLFLRILMILFGIVLFCGVGVFGAYYVLRESGASSLKENISNVENQMGSISDILDDEDFINAGNDMLDDPNLIWHDGRAYRAKEGITTILCMGIDQASDVIEQIEGVSGKSGQADSIFLLVMDTVGQKMSIIGMSRDTMTPIKTYDAKGNYVGKSVNHLALAYAFGNGKETSCLNMVDAVSTLFYGLPINAYIALNMEAVSSINDAVGGVPVTMTEDYTHINKKFVKGSTITLNGAQAMEFIRWRGKATFSNEQRVARQRQYVMSFMQRAIEIVKTDMTLPVKLYQSLTEEMVTNIGVDQVVYLTSQALSFPLSEGGIMMLQGESKQGTVYDEVYVDDEALYELILDVFYEEQQMDGEVK